MSGKKSKSKGAAFERKVAKLFSDAYEMDFRRTPLSGGWAKDAEVAAGDLVCLGDDSFPYIVECKKQEGWSFESLFTPDHAWFDCWWEQAVEECPNSKEPLLVFSRNYMPILVAMSSDVGFGVQAEMFASLAWNGDRIIITDLESFLEWDKEHYDNG